MVCNLRELAISVTTGAVTAGAGRIYRDEGALLIAAVRHRRAARPGTLGGRQRVSSDTEQMSGRPVAIYCSKPRVPANRATWARKLVKEPA